MQKVESLFAFMNSSTSFFNHFLLSLNLWVDPILLSIKPALD